MMKTFFQLYQFPASAFFFGCLASLFKKSLRINKPQPLDVKMTLTQSVNKLEAEAYSRLSQSPLRQIEHLSGIQDPHKHL